jgi:hypothetical protein
MEGDEIEIVVVEHVDDPENALPAASSSSMPSSVPEVTESKIKQFVENPKALALVWDEDTGLFSMPETAAELYEMYYLLDINGYTFMDVKELDSIAQGADKIQLLRYIFYEPTEEEQTAGMTEEEIVEWRENRERFDKLTLEACGPADPIKVARLAEPDPISVYLDTPEEKTRLVLLKKLCVMCHGPTKMRCSVCKAMFYCSKACQRVDRNTNQHAQRCNKPMSEFEEKNKVENDV